MPSPSTSPPLVRAVLAAVWLASCRGNTSDARRPGCDDGKMLLQRDLPGDLYRGCAGSAWPQGPRKHPAANRVHEPELQPARQVCMDVPIFYKQAIPHSGGYRPVMAESGEYVYCPPQRWLNNLHHGATVLLHHPCLPLRERVFLSVLARSCLTHYILSSHPKLRQDMPVALVSWGRTLELSTVASLDACDWLETTTSTRTSPAGVAEGRKYKLLLTRSAEGRPATTETPRRCCESTLSSFLVGEEEELRSDGTRATRLPLQAAGRRREIRGAERERGARDASQHSVDAPALNTSALPEDSQDLSPRTAAVLDPNVSEAAAEELNRTGGPGAPASEGGLGHGHGDAKTGAESVEPAVRPPGAGPPPVKKGLPKSPRTDEAVWAAAALGSLLVLLALAVLHTRLYRHWRTTPSLYWYSPHQDYESVADVIRRRLRIAKRRGKRSRRQQCVLLPMSSSSDEN